MEREKREMSGEGELNIRLWLFSGILLSCRCESRISLALSLPEPSSYRKTPGGSDLLKREDYRGFGRGLVGLGWVVVRCRLVRGCWSFAEYLAICCVGCVVCQEVG